MGKNSRSVREIHLMRRLGWWPGGLIPHFGAQYLGLLVCLWWQIPRLLLCSPSRRRERSCARSRLSIHGPYLKRTSGFKCITFVQRRGDPPPNTPCMFTLFALLCLALLISSASPPAASVTLTVTEGAKLLCSASSHPSSVPRPVPVRVPFASPFRIFWARLLAAPSVASSKLTSKVRKNFHRTRRSRFSTNPTSM